MRAPSSARPLCLFDLARISVGLKWLPNAAGEFPPATVLPKALPYDDVERIMSPVILEMHATRKAIAAVFTRDRFITRPPTAVYLSGFRPLEMRQISIELLSAGRTALIRRDRPAPCDNFARANDCRRVVKRRPGVVDRLRGDFMRKRRRGRLRGREFLSREPALLHRESQS